MMFEFATATRVVFGSGSVNRLGELTQGMGTRPLVVTGSNPERVSRVFDILKAGGHRPEVFTIAGEPAVDRVLAGVEEARRTERNWVVAVGGGSVMDAGKAIAGLLTNPGDLMDYLEVVGGGQSLKNASAPFVALPTTSGTGAEVTRNAVLSVPGKQFKVSLRSPHLLPRLALVDPELTVSAPQYVKACSGLDALTQLLEPWVGIRGNWMTDAFCREGLMKFSQAFPAVLEDAENIEAHEIMALASLLSGLALANSGLGVIHGFAAPLGGMYSVPHGAICARLAAPGVKANVDFLKAMERSGLSRTLATEGGGRGVEGKNPLDRYQHAAQMLLNDPGAQVEDLLAWLDQLVEQSQIPRLKDFGVQREDFSLISDKAMQSGSMKGNPIVLSKTSLIQILETAF